LEYWLLPRSCGGGDLFASGRIPRIQSNRMSHKVSPKILTLDRLVETLGPLRQKKKIVLCHGVFDLLHVGHLRYFEEARAMGDVLVVTLTSDPFVNRGANRPAFGEDLRAEMIAALACVDYVAINPAPTATDLLKKIRPNVYVKGPDYRNAENDLTGRIGEEEEAIKSVGGQIAFTGGITFSSTNLINRHMPQLPEEVRGYLDQFATRHPASEIIGYLKKAEGLKVLLVGETIIDEYVYCDAIGKSSKEPTLVIRKLSSEQFAGGILAAANHVASFAGEVGVLTMLGTENSYESYIEEKLAKNIKRIFVRRQKSPTIVKRRFIENYYFAKLMEIYEINDALLSEEEDSVMCDALREHLPNYDLVIVIDFGHSMISGRAIELLRKKAKFLAVNAQSNAGNLGYHVLSKYSSPDYMTAMENEIRLEARDHRGDIKKMVPKVCNKLKAKRMIMTRGKNGCLAYEPGQPMLEVPAVAGKVVDRIGAGDAFLSVSSLLAAQAAPLECVALAGNVAGAMAVATVGNRTPIDRGAMFKFVDSILK
jgi:rfaE bifunctional protein nucleotidyltransferase chain/domain